jgi:hypothetical protein
MSHARVRYRSLAIAALCLTTAAGCGEQVAARGVNDQLPSPSASSTASTALPRACPTLLDCLMPAPSGSSPWLNAGKTGALSLNDLVKSDYGALPKAEQQDVTARLKAEGLSAIVRRAWLADNGDVVDLFVYRFATSTGARSYYLSNTVGGGPMPLKKHLPGFAGNEITLCASKPDSEGGIASNSYVDDGDFDIEAFVTSPAKVDTASISTWLKRQLAYLKIAAQS